MKMDNIDNKFVRCILIELNYIQSPFFKISNVNTKDNMVNMRYGGPTRTK